MKTPAIVIEIIEFNQFEPITVEIVDNFFGQFEFIYEAREWHSMDDVQRNAFVSAVNQAIDRLNCVVNQPQ